MDSSSSSAFAQSVQTNDRYFLRAIFFYANYDGLSKPPTFNLQIDANKWATVVTSATQKPLNLIDLSYNEFSGTLPSSIRDNNRLSYNINGNPNVNIDPGPGPGSKPNPKPKKLSPIVTTIIVIVIVVALAVASWFIRKRFCLRKPEPKPAIDIEPGPGSISHITNADPFIRPTPSVEPFGNSTMPHDTIPGTGSVIRPTPPIVPGGQGQEVRADDDDDDDIVSIGEFEQTMAASFGVEEHHHENVNVNIDESMEPDYDSEELAESVKLHANTK